MTDPSPRSQRPAKYLALEGIEGAGKSSIAAGLVERLTADGEEVVQIREPGGTEAGELIRHILLDAPAAVAPWTEALLFAAARAQLAEEVVRPALDAGAFVVSDRSVYSSLAYQGGGRGLGVDRVRAANQPGLGPTWPSLVVLLKIEAEVGLARQQVADRIGAEGIAFQSVVAATFDQLATAEPDTFCVVDASNDLDHVVQQVYDAVRQRW
jgi:dTMP kinase